MRYLLFLSLVILASSSFAQTTAFDCDIKTFPNLNLLSFFQETTTKADLEPISQCFISYCKSNPKDTVFKSFIISERMIREEPVLIFLIIHSKALDKPSEKQSWFNLYALMNQEQIDKLYDILIRENKKMREIEDRYKNIRHTFKSDQSEEKFVKEHKGDIYFIAKVNQEPKIVYKKNGSFYLDETDELLQESNMKILTAKDFKSFLQTTNYAEMFSEFIFRFLSDNELKTIQENLDIQQFYIDWHKLGIDHFYRSKKYDDVKALLACNLLEYITDTALQRVVLQNTEFYAYKICLDEMRYAEAFKHYRSYQESLPQQPKTFHQIAFMAFYFTMFENNGITLSNISPLKKLLPESINLLSSGIHKTSYTQTGLMLLDFAIAFSNDSIVVAKCSQIKNELMKPNTFNYLTFGGSNKGDSAWYSMLTNRYFSGALNKRIGFEAIKREAEKLLDTVNYSRSPSLRIPQVFEYCAYYVLNQAKRIDKNDVTAKRGLVNLIDTISNTFLRDNTSSCYTYIEKHILNSVKNAFQKKDKQRKDIALLIATDKYANFTALKNPIYDAKEIGAELHSKFGFDTIQVFNGGLKEISNAITKTNQIAYDTLDQLLIFIAGHGYFDETDRIGYVATTNSEETDVTTMISFSNIRDIVNRHRCHHVLLLMDLCYAGTIFDDVAMLRGQETRGASLVNTDTEQKSLFEDIIKDKLRPKTRLAITSGGKETVSDGVNHSPFANDFLSFLRNSTSGSILDHYTFMSQIKDKSYKPVCKEFLFNEGGSNFLFIRK